MDLSQRKQQFSIAYVHVIATVAGCSLYKIMVDDDGVDLGIVARSKGMTRLAPHLEIQLKCSAQYTPCKPRQAHISFALKRHNYEDLSNYLA